MLVFTDSMGSNFHVLVIGTLIIYIININMNLSISCCCCPWVTGSSSLSLSFCPEGCTYLGLTDKLWHICFHEALSREAHSILSTLDLPSSTNHVPWKHWVWEGWTEHPAWRLLAKNLKCVGGKCFCELD